MAAIVLYHDDMDGRCSAFWVRKSLRQYHAKITMIPMQYHYNFLPEAVPENDEVYIVDFSLAPEVMDRLLERTKNVVWIDHHKSAIEKYEGYPHELTGIRAIGVAACVLTYLYFNVLTDNGRGNVAKFEDHMVTKVPMFTRLIGDRDIWAWVFGEKTKNFYAGLELCNTSPESQVWDDLLSGGIKITRMLEEQGKIVETFKRISRADMVGSYGYEADMPDFGQYTFVACNSSSYRSSEVFESLTNKYDVLIVYAHNGDQWHVSLYAGNGADVDVSEIAKKYGGGGHKGAAGFSCQELPFHKKVEWPTTVVEEEVRDEG